MTPQYGWRENLVIVCMLILAGAAVLGVVSFIVENQTDAPDVRVTVEQPEDPGRYRTRFN